MAIYIIFGLFAIFGILFWSYAADNLERSDPQERIDAAVEVALQYAQTDGGHHKMWVIDQMLRELLGNEYEARIERYQYNEEDPYEWDEGTPP